MEELQSRRRLDFENGGKNLSSDMNVIEEEENNIDEARLDDYKSIEYIHSQISSEMIPKIDMEFETEEEAYNFYNAYAYKVGFSIRKSKGHKDKSGNMMDRIFCCSCEGHRENDKRRVTVKCHRPETRFGCLARMKVNCRQTGKFRVVEFIHEHTHTTSSPNKSHLHRSQRRITPAQAAEIDLADNSGIAPKASMELIAKQVGGRENIGYTHVDYKNFLRTKRTTQMMLDDTGGVLEYLQRMQSEDPSFFYALQIDKDGLITNIFWADAKMMVAYSHFGDVVSFDTTYRKNEEGRPFAMFLGVNHHKQTTFFGTALLYDETAETFIWLFDTFAKAMLGKKPMTIFTDQDAAMAKALASQWPETSHRLCIFHLYQNAAKHLSGVFERFRGFVKDFSSCIYDYEEEDEFLQAWSEMLEKYELKDNEWLKRMFKLKEKWALVYGRDTFCADMTTTQRSESMNNAIKNYVSYRHDLLQFFHHFDRLVVYRRYEELRADFKATQSALSLSLPIEILKHAASIYTPAVFKMFEIELCKAYDCSMETCLEVETMTEYKIVPLRKRFHHTVKYDSTDGTVICSCKKFKFAGILCSHALKVLSSRNVIKIPSQYISKRWTKCAKSGMIPRPIYESSQTTEDPKASMGRRYKEICRLQTQVATKAAEREETYKIATHGLNKILEDIDACIRSQDDEITTSTVMHSNINKNNPIDGLGGIKRIKTKKKSLW